MLHIMLEEAFLFEEATHSSKTTVRLYVDKLPPFFERRAAHFSRLLAYSYAEVLTKQRVNKRALKECRMQSRIILLF